jgi:hypothetical protein
MTDETQTEDMADCETAAYTAVVEAMERVNPTLEQAQRVFTFLLADVSFELSRTPQIPQQVLDNVASAYQFTATEANEKPTH